MTLIIDFRYRSYQLFTYPVISKKQATTFLFGSSKYKREYSDEKYGFNTHVSPAFWRLCR
ncbi:hypothetical protein VCR12J2_620175 [Vibrio coralliirubri]|nr:hypothetical protein VCR1J2_200328 [Vibrio coralliirubri]CDT12994.1 hypothetical protein VCR4J2_250529 [Vibrio coralliirubri]CDT76033.1 hypothetical protein VCR8J2_190415 [Vibrio coralliirubri]CDT99879.1 hypothetical protein VCR12J2_620175 [Vibrio coralliirubri]